MASPTDVFILLLLCCWLPLSLLLLLSQELEPDTVALMAKRVYDVAGVLGKGCKVLRTGGDTYTYSCSHAQ